jgi:DMSO/TMAO reductase YedYZ heme-binding membrane subunit
MKYGSRHITSYLGSQLGVEILSLSVSELLNQCLMHAGMSGTLHNVNVRPCLGCVEFIR